MFFINDEAHAEQWGEFATLAEAMTEIRRLATIPWNEKPNLAPCTNWKKCGRRYEIIEYDNAATSYKELQRLAVVDISTTGVVWHEEWKQSHEQ